MRVKPIPMKAIYDSLEPNVGIQQTDPIVLNNTPRASIVDLLNLSPIEKNDPIV